ncbi:alpha/beta hydrolase [Fulvivirgaceae bacterium BMA12]|uniref:Alpha/beta hydrolase n=1 Tax=Agaribacillus aureus TaxID=3051825 RepID=A0ABT8LE05_9BACT|nr:alpha/beta hydrolase [Fulvivirgaceae bacterium BMA12]
MIKIYNIPGLKNAGPSHWQSRWENQSKDITRIIQDNWEQPDCQRWITRIDQVLGSENLNDVVLVAHSVGCAAVLNWFNNFRKPVKGALLVAPSDVDRPDYPPYITGFAPMPLIKLPFKSIVVASTNDHVVSPERARLFAERWGSQFIQLHNAGHIEDQAGFGDWPEGMDLLNQLR